MPWDKTEPSSREVRGSVSLLLVIKVIHFLIPSAIAVLILKECVRDAKVFLIVIFSQSLAVMKAHDEEDTKIGI